MVEELSGEDDIRFRYLEQHFQALLFLMALAVVPQVIYSDGNPWRVFAIVLCTPPACFAISWLSSRGRWLSKSEDADDPRYSHFRDIGGFVSMYALIIYFFFS